MKGIGKILSARIIKFRDKLGGFYTMNQLGEVYGVPPEVIDLLTSQYFVDAGFEPNTINVNTCTREELEAHPYIRRKLAELIINYRENHFPIELEDLANIPILTPEIQVKIIPYLSFE